MQCPICQKRVASPGEEDAATDSAGSKYFPFCCERCKLIDLGRWLGGRYQVPVIDEDTAAADPIDDQEN